MQASSRLDTGCFAGMVQCSLKYKHEDKNEESHTEEIQRWMRMVRTRAVQNGYHTMK